LNNHWSALEESFSGLRTVFAPFDKRKPTTLAQNTRKTQNIVKQVHCNIRGNAAELMEWTGDFDREGHIIYIYYNYTIIIYIYRLSTAFHHTSTQKREGKVERNL